MFLATIVTVGIILYLCCVYIGLRKMSKVLREGQDDWKH